LSAAGIRSGFFVLGGDDGVVVTEAELLASVDAAFEVTRVGLVLWPDPHPDRSPLDHEYSRTTDPNKWRIIGARADAWLVALVEASLATVERDAAVDWKVCYPGQ
jgi:hypothetical protein